jgi:hypothetical protein
MPMSATTIINQALINRIGLDSEQVCLMTWDEIHSEISKFGTMDFDRVVDSRKIGRGSPLISQKRFFDDK